MINANGNNIIFLTAVSVLGDNKKYKLRMTVDVIDTSEVKQQMPKCSKCGKMIHTEGRGRENALSFHEKHCKGKEEKPKKELKGQ
jgi:tRNA(Ile2) C34 agmatinyltransferase TiaS